MARAGEGLFKRFLPKNIHEKLRQVLEFRPNDPNRSWQVPAAKATIAGLDKKEYRSPSPNQQPQANVPISDDPDLEYDITYYKRDTRRNQEEPFVYVAPALRQLADERAEAMKQLTPEVGPNEKRPPPSQGRENPAVMRYDPTGLRTTMTASNKAWEESVQKYAPDHNVRPWWYGTGVDHVAEAQKKGLPPPPGRRMQWEEVPASKLASW